MSAAAGISASSRLSVNSSDHSGRSRRRFPAAPLQSPFFVFQVACAIFPTLPRHFVDLLDLPNLMNPAATMQKTSLCWNLTTVQGQQRAQSFSSCIEMSSHLWSDVAFDHWPTQRCIRALHRACLMTRRQACLRVTAPACAHLFALLHWQLLPLSGFLDIRRVSSSPELSPFCSACASIPWNLPQILSSGFFEEGASITQASVGENVALSSFLSLQTCFATFHASLRAHRPCCKDS